MTPRPEVLTFCLLDKAHSDVVVGPVCPQGLPFLNPRIRTSPWTGEALECLVLKEIGQGAVIRVGSKVKRIVPGSTTSTPHPDPWRETHMPFVGTILPSEKLFPRNPKRPHLCSCSE